MEDVIRLMAFKWLEDQVRIHGDVLPRKLLEKGFEFNGQNITWATGDMETQNL